MPTICRHEGDATSCNRAVDLIQWASDDLEVLASRHAPGLDVGL